MTIAGKEDVQVTLKAFGSLLDTVKDIAGKYSAVQGLGGLEVQGIEFAADALRAALVMKHLNNDPQRPIWTPLTDRTQKWAWEHPFTLYSLAPIEGSGTYRISGLRNDAHYIGFSVYGGGDERGGTMATAIVASRPDEELSFAEDGTFEVILSSEQHTGNWLSLDSDASSVVVRQYFTDPVNQTPARLHIERLDVPCTPAYRRRPDTTAALFNSARRFLLELDAIQQQLLDQAVNASDNAFLPPADRRDFLADLDGQVGSTQRPGGYMYGTADNVYTMARYRLSAHEALVFEVTPMQCRYWSAHLGTIWQQSAPYDENFGLIDTRNAALESKGALRVVVSERDPGVANWLPTHGHHLGVVLIRYLLPSTGEIVPVPTCKVVDLESLKYLDK